MSESLHCDVAGMAMERLRHFQGAQSLADRTVLVTGGGGLIGSRVVACLRAIGSSVRVLDRLDAYDPSVLGIFGVDREERGLTVGDVRDRATVRRLVSEAEFVVHAAAYADVAACTRNPYEAFASNVHGTQVVLDEVVRTRSVQRFVYVSSASVYGDGDVAATGMQCFTEDDPVSPRSVYANSKQWGEHQTRLLLDLAGIDYTILRLFSVYGHPQVPKPGSHSWAVALLSMHASLNLPMQLHGGGTQIRDFVHVSDVTEATIRALVAPAASRQTINVGTGKATSIRRLAELVADHIPTARFVHTPRPIGDPLGGFADTRRMSDLLGWTPLLTLDDGVAAYVEWLQATPEAVPPWLAAPSHGTLAPRGG